MIVTTTNTIEGKKIAEYLSIVSGEAILGANIFKDFLAGVRDIVGGRSETYEKELKEAQEVALKEMKARAKKLGADAIIGIDFDYETIGSNGSMLMVAVAGTAVKLEK